MGLFPKSGRLIIFFVFDSINNPLIISQKEYVAQIRLYRQSNKKIKSVLIKKQYKNATYFDPLW